jgi:hypothetical protein
MTEIRNQMIRSKGTEDRGQRIRGQIPDRDQRGRGQKSVKEIRKTTNQKSEVRESEISN